MILLDAYAVLALARGEGPADEVGEIIRSHDCGISAANYFEVADRLQRLWGWSKDETSERFALLFGQSVRVLPFDEATAWHGADLRARHYERSTCAVSLADCALLATAGPKDSIATADPAVAAVARAEGIGLIPLPDSAGQRP